MEYTILKQRSDSYIDAINKNKIPFIKEAKKISNVKWTLKEQKNLRFQTILNAEQLDKYFNDISWRTLRFKLYLFVHCISYVYLFMIHC